MRDNMELFNADYMKVFEYKGGWSWDCKECMVSGDNSPDRIGAEFEAEEHIQFHHTDLQPRDM